jgi:hypothetical protein
MLFLSPILVSKRLIQLVIESLYLVVLGKHCQRPMLVAQQGYIDEFSET